VLQRVNRERLTVMLTGRSFQRSAISREHWREMSFKRRSRGDRLALLLPTRFTAPTSQALCVFRASIFVGFAGFRSVAFRLRKSYG
jgi:hypothetical protein